MRLLPLGSYADLAGVVLMVAFLAFASASLWAATNQASSPTNKTSRTGVWVFRAWIILFDIGCLIALVVHYGEGIWFPSD